jgi:hypothetical protein
MAGYAVTATLRDGVAHPSTWSNAGRAEELLALTERDAALDAAAAEPIDLVGRPIDEAIAEWLASLGESWSQLTFFLFDPDSWR